MSININVHGNSIQQQPKQRSTILCDFDNLKKEEIERRKKLRLKQVREQSKEIAAQLRKKVQREKNRQLKNIERIKEAEIENWKEQQIKRAQANYTQALSKVGEAHLAAAAENERAKLIAAQQRRNRNIAVRRGREAVAKLAEKKVPTKASRKSVNVAVQVTQDTNRSKSCDNANRRTAVIQNAELKQSPAAPPSHIYASVNINENRLDTSSDSSLSNLQAKTAPTRPNPLPQTNIDSFDDSSINSPKTLPFVYSNPQSGINVCIKTSEPDKPQYNPNDFVAETTSESISLPAETPASIPFTQVSHLLNKRKQSKEQFDILMKSCDNVAAKVVQQDLIPTVTPPAPPNSAQTPLSRPTTSISKSPKRPASKTSVQTTKSILNRKTISPIKKSTGAKPKFHYIPQFTKSAVSLSTKSAPKSPAPKKKISTISSATTVDDTKKVQFYDHANRFSKEYDLPTDIVEKLATPPPEQPNAMDAAQEQMKLDELRLEKLEQLRKSSELRCQQTFERERVRRDYDLLNSQLDDLAKQENYARTFMQPNQQFSEERLRQMASDRQQKMNNRFEEILHKPILITCPRINDANILVDSAAETSSSLNVAQQSAERLPPPPKPWTNNFDSSESCSSILLGYVDNRSKNLIDDITREKRSNRKTEELMNLLERINQQKRLLTKELENNRNSDALSARSMENVLKNVQNIEKEKFQLLNRDEQNKENLCEQNLEKQRKKLDRREKQLKLKEQKLEEKIKELFIEENKRQHKFHNVEIQTDNAQNTDRLELVEQKREDMSLEASSSYDTAPVQIIIKVNEKRKRSRTEKKIQQKPISDKPGEIFPKTPAKKIEKVIEKNEIIEISSTASTLYRSPPNFIHTNLSKALLHQQHQNKEVTKTKTPPPAMKPSKLPPKSENKAKINITQPALMHYITRLLGMSRSSIEQLGVSSSASISTPSDSVINVSDNFSQNSGGFVDDQRLSKLKQFIDDNHQFLKEMNESLSNVDLSDDHNESVKTVEQVWMRMLQTKEKEMKKLKNEGRKLKEVLRKKEQKELAEKVPIKPILKKSSPKNESHLIAPPVEQIFPSNSPVEPQLMEKYSEITENCSRRIADLTEMINKVRLEKQKLLENTFSSMATTSTDKGQNSTEYLDFHNHQSKGQKFVESQNDSSQASDLQSLRKDDEPQSEETSSRRIFANSKQIGISRDSGISLSRPVTSSDIRDSPDIRHLPALSERFNTDDKQPAEPQFEPILKDIPKYDYQLDPQTTEVKRIVDEPLDAKKSQQKPPTSLKRYSPLLNEDPLPAHELSTIMEVDTPATSRINASINSTRKDVSATANVVGELIKKFPTFMEYARAHNLDLTQFDPEISSKLSKEFEQLLNLNGHSPSELRFRSFRPSDASENELHYKKFPKHQEYAKDITGLCESGSIDAAMADKTSQLSRSNSSSSISDIEAEMRKRNLLVHSLDSLSIKSDDNDGDSNVDMVHTKAQDPLRISTSSSEENLEMDFGKIGLQWASTMLKKIKTTHALTTSSSSSSFDKRSAQQIESASSKPHSFVDSKIMTDSSSAARDASLEPKGRPLNLKEFLTRELDKRTRSTSLSDDSSTLANQFLKSLLSSSSSYSSPNNWQGRSTVERQHSTQRTSTPVKTITESPTTLQKGAATTQPTNDSDGANNYLFSSESRLSSVRATSMSSSKETTASTIPTNSSISADDDQRGHNEYGKLAVPMSNLKTSSSSSSK